MLPTAYIIDTIDYVRTTTKVIVAFITIGSQEVSFGSLVVYRKNSERRRIAAAKLELKLSIPRPKLPVKDYHHMSVQLSLCFPPWFVQKAEGKVILGQLDTSTESPMHVAVFHQH